MFDPWSHEGTAQAALTRTRASRWRLLSFVLLGLLVWAVWPAVVRPAPHYRLIVDGPPPVVAPSGQLQHAFDVARPATLRIELRCTGVFGRQVAGLGSGFFFEPDGHVLTAYHVVDTGNVQGCAGMRYVAVDSDRREYGLELVGFDAYMDLAVMRARVSGAVPYIPLATRAPSPGTDVVAIGNSRGDFLGGRAGRVTRLGVRAGRPDFADDTIELTVSLAPGDSGGPVVTVRGEAVGVVSYISFNPGRMESSGHVPPFLLGVPLPRDFASYAVPVEVGSELVSTLRAGAMRDVPVIGFRTRMGNDYDPATSEVDLGPRPGPIIDEVAAGGPAERAGLRSFSARPVLDGFGNRVGTEIVADVIVAVDGVATPTFSDLLAAVRTKEVGDVVEVSVQRGDATYRVPLELGARRAVFAGSGP